MSVQRFRNRAGASNTRASPEDDSREIAFARAAPETVRTRLSEGTGQLIMLVE
jgi:hypothetical protein